MNGIDRIRDRMERDARAERDAIRAEGEQQAAALAAQYRAQAEELAKQAAARREQTAAESLRQADSADQLERRQCLLAERQRCIDLAFEQAASQLRTLPQEQYVQVLAHIAAETGTGSEELIFSPADREAVGAQVTERASALKPGAAFRLSAETGDARRSDLLVDAACFAHQLELARSSGCQILADYVRALIDGANLKSLVRTLRLKKDAAFLRELLLPGGTVSPERIVQHGFSSSAAELFAGSALAQAAQAAEAAAAGGSLTELERLCDNAALNVIGRARRVPFGVEVPVGYVAARENELMSVRLVITGLLAGIPADQIRERLRETNG